MDATAIRKKYEAVATIVELRHVAADVKRLEALKTQRHVVEHAELAKALPDVLEDLDKRLAVYEDAQAAKRELAKKAAAEGDAMVEQKKPETVKQKQDKAKAAAKKAASKRHKKAATKKASK